MKQKVFISFITVTKNNMEGLDSTLSSYVSFFDEREEIRCELIVVDGGSVDATDMVVKRYEKYITNYQSEADFGIYDAMTKGVNRCNGNLVCFLNAGDTLISEGMKSYIRSSDSLNNCYFAKATWDGGDRMKHRVLSFKPKLLRMPNHQTMIFPKWFLLKHPFSANYPISADLDQKLTAYDLGILVERCYTVVNSEPGGLSTQYKNLNQLLCRANEHAAIAKSRFGIHWGILNYIKIVVMHGLPMVFRASSPRSIV